MHCRDAKKLRDFSNAPQSIRAWVKLLASNRYSSANDSGCQLLATVAFASVSDRHNTNMKLNFTLDLRYFLINDIALPNHHVEGLTKIVAPGPANIDAGFFHRLTYT